MRAYVDQTEREDVPPWATEEGLRPWREGEVVDLGGG
jgi:hypothetical protein